MAWLLTGGAGYIGSHVARAFLESGRSVVILDDMSSGFEAFVPAGVKLHRGAVQDRAAVASAFDAQPVQGVVHLAGMKYAGESVNVPLFTYESNVEGTRVLLEAMAQRGVEKLVFSSSAACYGNADEEVVREDAPTRPESPYGESKLIGEWLIRSQARARPQLKQTSLRYFNVVGSGSPELTDHSPYNLFPRAFRALSAGQKPTMFGDDYPTEDGSCVRDYVHVADLAEAHLRAANLLEAGTELAPVYNVGRGEGSSVREVMEAIVKDCGGDGYAVKPRRPGDPARIVGSAELIERDFGWKPQRDLQEMVSSAWAGWNTPAARAREAASRL